MADSGELEKEIPRDSPNKATPEHNKQSKKKQKKSPSNGIERTTVPVLQTNHSALQQPPFSAEDQQRGEGRPEGPERTENLPVEHIPRIITRRIPSPVFLPPFNYTDKAFFGGLILVTVAAFATRLYKLNEPNHVA